MKYIYILLFVIVSVLLIGCGGGGTTLNGQVSGVVFDANGNVVRGARVWVDGTDHSTYTNSDGLYVLDIVPATDKLIRVSVDKDGVTYVGSNIARVFEYEQSKNVNIVIVRQSQAATVKGIVYDNQGHALQGAKVYALIQTGGVYSSSMAITNSSGAYTIRHLVPGVDYTLVASGRDYQSDTDTVNLDSSEQRTVLFTLGNALDVLMPVPQNVEAISWTTPREDSRSPKAQSAYEAIKRKLDPIRAKRKTTSRYSAGGNWIEVDLYWDAISNNNLLGFGIYRASDAFSTTTAIDYLRDPQSSYFSDLDTRIVEDATYSYQVTSLNSGYPESANGESAKSDRCVVNTLGDLDLDTVTQGPVTFHWFAATGATSYTVYLYDTFPSFDVDSIWSSGSTGSTSYIYDGPALSSGHRYYYIVLGTDGDTGRTLSVVGNFVKN